MEMDNRVGTLSRTPRRVLSGNRENPVVIPIFKGMFCALITMSRLAVQVVIVFAVLFALAAQASARDREYIILTGGPSLIQWEKYKAAPHDLWWMNFIRAARLRIQPPSISVP